MLEKSRTLAVDTAAYDLEDSVTPNKKEDARNNIISFLSQPRPPHINELAVRINAVSSGLALNDLTAVLKAPNLDCLVVPKVNTAADLHFVTDVLRHALPERHPLTPAGRTNEKQPLKILALIESAEA